METKKTSKALFIAAAMAVVVIVAFSVLPIAKYFQPTQPSTASGTLSILLTDPPNLPANVTNVYLSFSSIIIHNTQARDNKSGWYTVGGSGTIELTSVINLSKVIAVSKVQAGDYNLIRFNISSVLVTYNGKNYTALTPSNSLTVVIHPKLEVEDGSLAAAIVDVSPTVLNTGNASSPRFILLPAAHASPVPKGEVSEDMKIEGKKIDLRVHAWWKEIQESFSTNISITSASISSSNLSVTVKNTGNVSTRLGLVIVTPTLVLPTSHNEHGEDHEVPLLFHSAVFLVEKNGSLLPVYKLLSFENINSDEPYKDMDRVVSLFGYNLSSRQSVTLSYTGPVILFPPEPLAESIPISPLVITGSEYKITVIGSGSIASTTVKASSSTSTKVVSFYIVTSSLHDERLFILFVNTGTETISSYMLNFSNGSNLTGTLNVAPGSLGTIMRTLSFQLPQNTSSVQIKLTLISSVGMSSSETVQVQVRG